ncbi:MAG: hypothetical protein ACLFV4_05825 [Candidatus Hydrogenedentota bacterium]
MITYTCDGCGKTLGQHDLRYVVKIDVKAAYDEMEVSLLDLVRDHRAEMLRLIEQMKHKDAEQLEEGVFKNIKLDLCPTCQRAFIRNPLRFHPEQGASETNVDVDAFLRSLGIGKGPEERGQSGGRG